MIFLLLDDTYNEMCQGKVIFVREIDLPDLAGTLVEAIVFAA